MIFKIKIRNNRYICDVNNCDNYAYAEMYRIHKGWQYVCKKHYDTARKRNEKDVGFYILNKKEKISRKNVQKL